MKSRQPGRSTLEIDVTNVSMHGSWVLVESRESFVPFSEFPWFRDASISQLTDVEIQSSHHLFWPQLDIDLAVESLDHPDRYPQVSRVQPHKQPQSAVAPIHERGSTYRTNRRTRRGSAAKNKSSSAKAR